MNIYFSHSSQFILSILCILLFSLACDDETSQSKNNDPFMRDASINIDLINPINPGTDVADMMVNSIDMDTTWGSSGEEAGEQAGTNAGAMSLCQSGERLLNQNECGYQICSGGMWVEPASLSEICNGHDDDCDGRLDESFNLGAMCYVMENGCQVEGVYECNQEIGTARCVSTGISTANENCDGIDNDCDGMVDEGFPAQSQCCSSDLHCGVGQMCTDGLCGGSSTGGFNTGTNPTPFQNLIGGSCNQPIVISEFGTYIPTSGNSEQNLTVANCTGNLENDFTLALQTSLGREVVLSFSLPMQQRVRISTQYLEDLLILSAPVIYVRQAPCNDDLASSLYCDQSIVGVSDEPARNAMIEFMAQANVTYFIIIDSKVDFAGDIATFPILFEGIP